jgi:large subunit ribosomal protein L7/L12
LTLLEAAQLAKMLRDNWGITETVAPMMRAPNMLVTEIEKAVEQEYFSVVLKDIGPKKIEVIKAVRQITNLGLKDAKDMVEAPSSVVVSDVGKDEATRVKTLLESAGAVVALV